MNFQNARLRWRQAVPALLILCACVFPQTHSVAGTVVLRIEATNPADNARDVPIKSALPHGIRPDDVLSTAELTLEYDVNSGSYFVHGTINLDTNEKRQLDIVLRDIWLIPESDLDTLKTHVESLLRQFPATEKNDDPRRLASEIAADINLVCLRQQSNTAAQVGPLKHEDHGSGSATGETSDTSGTPYRERNKGSRARPPHRMVDNLHHPRSAWHRQHSHDLPVRTSKRTEMIDT